MTPALEQIKALPEVQRTAPERIYLTVSDDPYDAERPFPADHGDELCWCQDEAVSVCVPYVRADLAALQALRDEAGEAVVFNCHRCPVSVEARWQPPECPECGDPCEPDYSAKPYPRPAPAAEAAPQGGERIDYFAVQQAARDLGIDYNKACALVQTLRGATPPSAPAEGG